jgi:hypothetical protein
MKKRHYLNRTLYYAFIISLLINASFALAETSGENKFGKYDKSILFTEDGYYRFPPALPGEKQESLGQWELPRTELELSEATPLSSTLSSGDVVLLNGWNYISFPKTLMPYNGWNQGGYVFADVDTGGRSIYTYDASTGMWDSVTSTTIIEPLIGYAVYSVGTSTANTNYYPPGQQQNPSITLYPGWNLVGYFDPMGNYNDDFLHAAMAREELGCLGSDWCYYTGWDAASQQYETTIIRGADEDDHSEYRLAYPTKGYWLYMIASRNLAFATDHDYTCSAEWVGEYPGGDDDLPDSQDNVEGFYDTLIWDSFWEGAFIRGDNDNPIARAADWKDSSYPGGMDDNPSTGIDSTNFAYFSGHGWAGAGILFSYGYPNRDEQELWYDEAIWGDTKVDWIVLDACSVLNESNNNYAVWQDSFKGLHSIVGWDTIGMCCEDTGLLFAENLLEGSTIWKSWKDATDSVIHFPGYKVGILAVDIDGNTNTEECIDDHIYGHGTWFSPPGYDVEFDQDFYDVNSN